MIRDSRLKSGIILILVAAFLLFAGCIQQPGVGTPTTTPTSPPATSTAVATATPDLQDTKTQVASLAAGYAREIDGDTLSTAIRDGPNSTAFATALGQLRAFKANDSRVVYVYTVEQENGTVRFLIDADYGLPDGSEFLSAYPDAPAELKNPVTAPIGVGPYTDSWGTFISGYAPVNTGSNATIVLVGVDFRI
jgi:hypothetical protein